MKNKKKKNVWILNHYASMAMYEKGGRHYWFAKELLKKGYLPTILCADIIHNVKEKIEIENGKYGVKISEGIPFVLVKTVPYRGNGVSRIRNMLSYYRSVQKIVNDYLKTGAAKPDVILASSVHPLTCSAGLRIARKLNIPCIVEIRDLWPEDFVSGGMLKAGNPIVKVMYQYEKALYQKADAVVFTMEGGAEYISDKKWDIEHGGKIDLNKVYNINNGVLLSDFDSNAAKYVSDDADLNSKDKFNLVYTGSIRWANDMGILLDMAKELKDIKTMQLLIWGGGNYVEELQRRIKEEHIDNVIYKGVVPKSEIPGIITKSDVNIINWRNLSVLKYGTSYNKFFEYLAAGKPIFSTVKSGYSVIKRNHCGIEAMSITAEECAKDIRRLYNETEERNLFGKNAREAAKEFDFTVLTDKLINIIESL